MKKPQKFGKYLLLERINVGGMAEVFKAKSFGVEGFEKLVAIKRILPNIAEDEEFITMFIDEAKIAVQLNHANIAQIFDLGRIDDSYFIALEFVHGKDLRTIWERHKRRNLRLPVPMSAYIMTRVCEGLDYAHRKRDAGGREMNIVHRDVSPQNVLISYEGEVKIIDFGIAKAANKASKTQAGILKGKFGYMSPEQVRGLPLDRRSDVFSAGIILYELLTGERLFVGESDFSTLEKVRNVEILPPKTYNQNIPDDLERIVIKALSKDPDDRFQSAYDMQEELQRFLIMSKAGFSRKELAAYMKKAFRTDIQRELERHKLYEKATMPGQPADLTEPELPTNRLKQPAQPALIESVEDDEDEDIETVVWDARAALADELPTDAAPPAVAGKPPARPAVAPPPPPLPPRQKKPPPRETPAANQDATLQDLPVEEDIVSTADDQSPAPAPPFFSEDAFSTGEVTLAEEPRQARRKSRFNLLIILLAMVAVGLFGFAVVKLLRQKGLLGGTTSLEISSTPPRVKLLLDGKPIGHRADGIKPGRHHLQASADNYQPYSEEIELKPGRLNRLAISLRFVPAVLKLQVQPPQASVKVDGQSMEAAGGSLRLENMLPGREHLIEVTADGYRSEKFAITLAPRQVEERKITLQPLLFSLEVETTPPGALIFLDDKEVGRSPRVLEKLPATGQHHLRLQKKGYQNFTATIVYDGNDRKKVSVTLSRQESTAATPAPRTGTRRHQKTTASSGTGYLVINARPWGKVVIDGKDTGKTTPLLSYPVPAGRHRVTILFNGGGSATRTVDVVADRKHKVIVNKD